MQYVALAIVVLATVARINDALQTEKIWLRVSREDLTTLFRVGERIVVSMVSSIPLGPETDFEIDFGDGSARVSVNESKAVLSHIYEASGDYTVTAFLNNTAEGYTVVPVKEKRFGCVQFDVLEGLSIIGMEETVELQIGLKLVQNSGLIAKSHRFSPDDLAREFIALGERPLVQLTDDPDLRVAQLDGMQSSGQRDGAMLEEWAIALPNELGDRWVVRVKGKDWTGTAWLRIESGTRASLNGECTIESKTVPLTISPLAHLFANNSKFLKSADHFPVVLQNDKTGYSGTTMSLVRWEPCIPSIAVAVSQDKELASSPSLFFTYSGFRKYLRIELDSLRWGQPFIVMDVEEQDETITFEKVCQSEGGTLDCISFRIRDIQFLSSTVIIVVSETNGLFLLNLEALLLHPLLAPTTFKSKWKVIGQGYCVGEPGPEAIHYLMNNNGVDRGVMLHASDVILHVENSWDPTTLIKITHMEQLAKHFESTGYAISAFVADPGTHFISILFTNSAAKPASFIGRICNDNQVSQDDVNADPECWDSKFFLHLKPTLGFVFPVGTKVNGLCPHATGLAVFAFGDGLWISFDGGKHFTLKIGLEEGEFIEECPHSSPTKGMYTTRTTEGRLFFSTLQSAGAGEVDPVVSEGTQVGITSDNEVFLLRFDSEESNLVRLSLSIEHDIGTRNFAISKPIAVSDVQGNDILVSCIKSKCFWPQHKGMFLNPLGAEIFDVDISTGVARAKLDNMLSRDQWQSKVGQLGRNISSQCSLHVKSTGSIQSGHPGGQHIECTIQTPIPVSVNLNCSGVLQNLDEGVELSILILSNSFHTTIHFDGKDSICVFGAVLSQDVLEVDANDWFMLNPSDQWSLHFPPCELGRFELAPHLASPVVRLLDKYDMFLWKGIVEDQSALLNRGYTAISGDWWNTLSQQRESQYLLNNARMLHFTVAEFLTENPWANEWSRNVRNASFYSYQRITPAKSSMLHLDRDIFNVKNVILHVEPTKSIEGMGTVLLSPNRVGVSCAASQHSAVARLLVTCPFYKRLEYVPASDATYYDLPVNYRPPSERGKGIPLTPNVYNADPSQPLYMDWYKISRDSALFKQCWNATSREECTCNSASTLNSLVENSDCITTVQSTLYSNFFVPSFYIHTGRNGQRVELQSTYRVKDLNGRKDYCTNSSDFDVVNCGDITSGIEEFGFNSTSYDAILFVGEGLYHFEVTILDPISMCELKTNLLLFVLEPPLSTRNESITISLTAVSLLLCALFSYLAYFYLSRKENEGDLGMDSG